MSENCPICGLPGLRKDHSHYETRDNVRKGLTGDKIYCEDCGDIYFHSPLFRQIKIEQEHPERYHDTLFKMACLLYERKLKDKLDTIAFYMKDQGKPQYSSYPCYEYEDWVKSFPVDPLAKIDRALLNFKNYVREDISKTVDISSNACTTEYYLPPKIMFCKDVNSARELANLMDEMGYIKKAPGRSEYEILPGGDSNLIADELPLRITAKGWQRISELHDQQAENSETCFVAMAYNESTDKYREAVREALRQTGYRTDEITVIETHHNNFIMDEVINQINEAKFVIADFTTLPENDEDKEEPKTQNGVRGGVYWEAGYARGLKKEVIHTRRDDEDSRRRLHFDVEQINTIFWKEDNFEEFTKKLAARIKATVGRGPLPVDYSAGKIK
jgi:nucleoside 2-deoxyribosyltransferase